METSFSEKMIEFIDEPGIDNLEYKLALLLMNDVIFINNGWWKEKEGWPKDNATLHVNCNDVFAWGCADAEDILHDEIKELYDMWRKDETWGSTCWCIKKRKCMPQKPVEDLMRKSGIDVEALLK